MNIIDIIILLCFIPAVINGLRKGLVAQAVAIISIILGVWLSFRFSSALSGWLGQWLEASSALLNAISFATILIIVIFLLFAIGKLIEASIKIIMLGWLNKLLGVLFSILKCLLILGLLIVVFNTINTQFGLVPDKTLSDSALYMPLKDMAYTIFPYLKELLFK